MISVTSRGSEKPVCHGGAKVRYGCPRSITIIRHFSLLNVNAAGASGYDFLCDGGRLVRAYVRLRRGAM